MAKKGVLQVNGDWFDKEEWDAVRDVAATSGRPVNVLLFQVDGQPMLWNKTMHDIEDAQKEGNLDLAILVGFRLAQRHKMRLRLITTLNDESENNEAMYYLHQIVDVARLPNGTDAQTVQGDLFQSVSKAPTAAVNIFGLPNPYQQDFVHHLLEISQDACLFVKSSGNESVLV